MLLVAGTFRIQLEDRNIYRYDDPKKEPLG